MPVFTLFVSLYAWQSTFHLSFVLSLVPLVLITWLTADRPAIHRRVNAAERTYIEQALATADPTQGERGARLSAGSRGFLVDYRFWLLMLILASNSILSWGLLSWFPTYLKQARGFDWDSMGMLSALPFVFGLVAKIVAGVLVDRSGRSATVIMGSAALCALALYLGVHLDNRYMASLSIAIGIGMSSMQIPAIFTLLQSLVQARSISSAAGVLNGVAVGFGALSPVLIGLSSHLSGGFDAAFYLMIVIVLTGGGLAAILARHRL